MLDKQALIHQLNFILDVSKKVGGRNNGVVDAIIGVILDSINSGEFDVKHAKPEDNSTRVFGCWSKDL